VEESLFYGEKKEINNQELKKYILKIAKILPNQYCASLNTT